MKIIRLVTSLHFGGVEKRLVNLSEWQDEKEWVFAAIEGGGEAARTISENGKRLVVFKTKSKIPSWKAVWLLFWFFRSERPDVVHTSGAEANFHGIIAAKLTGVPKIIAEEIGIPSQSKLANWVFSGIYQLSDWVVANSEQVAEYLSKRNLVKSTKLRIIPNPLGKEPSFKIPFSEFGKFEIITVSRLEPVKNMEGLIRAMAKLIPSFPFLRLNVVGDGSQLNFLNQLRTELGLERHIRFLGFQADPWSVVNEADLFLLNSHTEGFSNALAEAMAAGIPCLATDVGAGPDMIKDGETGWLIPPGNSEQLIQKISYLVMKPKKELMGVGNKGKDWIRQTYSLESHIKNLMRIYQ